MDLSRFAFPAVLLLGITTVALQLSRRWRWQIGALGAQYLGVFVLVTLSWPSDLAAVKLVVGWMAGAILGTSQLEVAAKEERRWPTERWYFLFVALLVILTVATVAPKALDWVPGATLDQVGGGLLLIGMGVIHMGFASRGMRVILGLLTMLAGFEILYAAVEISALVAGLLAVINLGIAMAGAYLMTNMARESTI